MKIEVGSIAPDFSLYSPDKEKVSLSDYKNKNVVLLFFPLAFTRVCTKELCSVRDNIGVFNTSPLCNFFHGMKGVSKRSAFVIDHVGRVQYAEGLENAGEEPDYEVIEKCLARLN